MNRKTVITIALSVLGLGLVVSAGFGAISSSDPGPRVESFEVVKQGCDDGNYTSEIEQKSVESGTRLTLTETFVGATPSSNLSAEVGTGESPASYTLRITSDGAAAESDCRGELVYQTVVFVPTTTDFEFAVVHDGEVATVVRSTENGSSASSSSSARG